MRFAGTWHLPRAHQLAAGYVARLLLLLVVGSVRRGPIVNGLHCAGGCGE